MNNLWWANPITNLTLLEDEFKYKIVSKARKRAPLPEKEALLILERKKRTKEPRTPPLKETLQKALKWQALLDSGEVATRSEIARRENLSRARVTQIMCLLNLAPDIQNHILNLPKSALRSSITDRALRPITQIDNHRQQLEAFQGLVEK